MITNINSQRPQGQENVLRLTCPPIEEVRIGIVGLGVRAKRAVHRFIHIEGASIGALCDIVPSNVAQGQAILQENQLPPVKEYSGEEGWREICEQEDIDLIYICTDWESHTPIAVYAMECGKHVAIEVPAATTVAECWQLVDTAERTRRHCMMLENACYDAFELTTLRMVQCGLFGEVIHAEGAYIHDLRERILSNEHGLRFSDWQIQFNQQHTGNLYPTHGLGPVCQLLNIHRGDRMNRLVSMSTKPLGMALYARELYGADSPQAQVDCKLGDMNTTLINTERGKTILLQYNVSNPRPYDRIYLVNGTKGYARKYPVPQFAFAPNADDLLSEEQINGLFETYEHPFLSQLGSRAREVCGERARDYIMDYRLIHCLRNGLPLDQDVYDAAEWSCLVELTEQSVRNGSCSVEIPDFTRGDWDLLKSLEFAG